MIIMSLKVRVGVFKDLILIISFIVRFMVNDGSIIVKNENNG